MQGQSREDYLREIYSLSEKSTDGAVSSVDIAQRLGISKAAVSKMLGRLRDEKLVRMTPYSRIEFTRKGRQAAAKVIFKHRIIEVFLVEVLHVDRKNIHEEAHALEHAFSDRTIRKLALFLGNPKMCPCGHDIPDIEGNKQIK